MDSLIPIVLVIDDGPISPAVVKRTVRERGVRVIAVNNIEDARTAFQEKIPNIVVLNACLNGRHPDTKPFIEELRTVLLYSKTIIITSVEENYRRRLSRQAEQLQHNYLLPGQTISVDYDDLPRTLLRLLRRHTPASIS